MKKYFVLTSLAICVLLMLPAAGSAQDVDFSGKWVFNKDKSEVPERGDRGGRGGGRGGMRGGGDMVITHKADKFTIETERENRRTGEMIKNKTEMTIGGKATVTEGRRGTTTSKAKWDKDKKTLIVEDLREMSTQMGDMTIETTRKFTLSADGKVLTVDSVMETPRGSREMTLAYDKK